MRGGERPRLVLPEPGVRLGAGLNLELAITRSDYPDNADHARVSLVSSAEASGRCGLVLDLSGLSGEVSVEMIIMVPCAQGRVLR